MEQNEDKPDELVVNVTVSESAAQVLRALGESFRGLSRVILDALGRDFAKSEPNDQES